MPNRHAGGCRCCKGGTPVCPGPVSIGVGYSACNGRLNLAEHPLTVQVSGPGYTGPATVTYQTLGTPQNRTYAATANIGGITQTGTYTFTCTSGDFFSETTTVVVPDLCNSRSNSQKLYLKNYPVSITGCNAMPQPGATVQLSYPGGGGSGTTGEDGKAIVSLSAPIPGPSDIYMTVTAPHWQTCTKVSNTFGGVGECGANLDLSQFCEPESCYICCTDSGTIESTQCVELTTNRRSVTTPVGSKTVTIGTLNSAFGNPLHKVTKTVKAYRVKANQFYPQIAQRYIDPNTLQPVVEDLPVDFYLVASCDGIAGAYYACYSDNPNNLNPGQQAALMRTGYALASPSTVGATEHDRGEYFIGGLAGGGSGIGAGGVKTGGRNSCSPRSYYGRELVTGYRYGDGQYTSDEAGCAGSPYDGGNPYDTTGDPDTQALGYDGDEPIPDGDGNLYMVD